MITILLVICIPVTALVTGFLVFKSVQLGLRWQMEVKQEQLPTLETPIKNPIQPILESKAEKEQANVFNEWLNGETK
jgi:hypothetical protein